MGVVQRCCTMFAVVICAFVSATESGDLLDTFNEITLDSPSVEFELWGGASSINSAEFKTYFSSHFNSYIDLATNLSLRAIACADGKIPQADGYQSMTDVHAVYSAIDAMLTQGRAHLSLWVNSNDQSAFEALETNVPKLTVSYSRMLFELSNCSGYLYGELVN